MRISDLLRRSKSDFDWIKIEMPNRGEI